MIGERSGVGACRGRGGCLRPLLMETDEEQMKPHSDGEDREMITRDRFSKSCITSVSLASINSLRRQTMRPGCQSLMANLKIFRAVLVHAVAHVFLLAQVVAPWLIFLLDMTDGLNWCFSR